MPARCSRLLLILTSVIIVAAGALVIWTGYEISQMEPLKTEDLEFIGYIILAIGAGLAVVGILGFLGTCFKSRTILVIFATFALLMGIALAAFGIGLLYGRSKVGDILKTEKDCAESDEFKDANSAVEAADALMCKDECPCDMDPDLVARYILLGEDVTLGSADNVQDCDPCSSIENLNETDCETSDEIIDKYFSNDEKDYFSLLEWCEDKFDCSGICYPGTYYLFSDVNNGIPEESCMDSLRDWLEEQLLLYGIITLVSGLILLFGVILAYCLTCSPSCKGKG